MKKTVNQNKKKLDFKKETIVVLTNLKSINGGQNTEDNNPPPTIHLKTTNQKCIIY
jgi:hypothetical protein